jgi:signal transduction histidine kinase
MNTRQPHCAWQKFIITRTLLALATVFSVQIARADLLFYDGFEYPAGEELGELSSAHIWENDKIQFTIGRGSLEYAGLATSRGNRVKIEPTGPSLDGVRTVSGAWAEQSHGTLYLSFLLRLESAAGVPSTGDGTSLLTVSHISNNSQLLGINLLHDGTVRLGVLKQPSDGEQVSSSTFFTNGAGANLSADGSTTYLIVAKYEWMEGAANDRVTLWVNPTTLGAGEDAGNKVSTSTGADGIRSAGRLTLSRGPNVSLDELRIGQSWAEVTPPGGPPQRWFMVSLLVGGLVAAGLWITHLRRKVQERSAALGAQIQQRQQAEQQRLVEQERARIARDLHDELGADITEISMLATRARGDRGGGEEERRCMDQVADKTRQMVAKLEEIVWAMNPQHDSLGALVSYFSFFADRFLGLANIRLAVDTSEEAASLVVEARLRHQLFLVFREALANVVRHSGASEVRLVVRVRDGDLQVAVADNGCGLRELDPGAAGHEGLASMRRRMEKLGGQFAVLGEAGQGTTVRFSVPLPA